MSRRGSLILLVPAFAAIAFVAMYARPTPLTDEWLLLRNALIADDLGWSDPAATLSAMAWRIGEHPIVLPNLIYLPIGALFHYDSRALVAITLLCFGALLWVFSVHIAPGWAALPVALVLFAPSHYMEFVWGFQFAMALSITLPVLGLAVVNATPSTAPFGVFALRLTTGAALIVAGVLSSAAGAFGFFGLFVLAMLKRTAAGRRAIIMSIAVTGCLACVALLSSTGTRSSIPDLRSAIVTLTAMGAILAGSPVAVFDFPLDIVVASGLALSIIFFLCVLIAFRERLLDVVALPTALFTMGTLSVVAVTLARPYLGNWHLQLVLPAILGAYGAAVSLARRLKTPTAFGLQGAATTVLCLVALGYALGFGKWGPEYNAYARSIETYAIGYLENPDADKPFPVTGGWDLDAAMVCFLIEQGHALFADPSGLPSGSSAPRAAAIPAVCRNHDHPVAADGSEPPEPALGVRDLVVQPATGQPKEPAAPVVTYTNSVHIQERVDGCTMVSAVDTDPYVSMRVPDGRGLYLSAAEGGPAQVFLDDGSGYSEDQSLWFELGQQPYEIYMPVGSGPAGWAIRVDPPDGQLTTICLTDVVADGSQDP